MPRQYSNGGRDARRPSGSAAIGAAAAPGRSLKERVGALRNLRPFLTMVWHTSRQLTAASLVLRLVRAVMPVVTLYVGKLIIDNVVRDGAVINPNSSDPGVLGVRRMTEMIAAEKRVSATTIQTVGSKGYDGFTILRVMG